MRYVLGVDGGGSKTACLAADETGRLLGYGQGGPVNTNYVTRQEAANALRQAVLGALQTAGLRGEHVERLCLSAPMAPEAVAEAIGELGLASVCRAAEGETPRWAARFWIEQRIGVTVDAGTGSMARGWSKDGRQAGAGGWGATLGDEGSGYWIGMQAMIAVLQAYDGRINQTMLTQPVLERYGMAGVLDMVFRVSQGLVEAVDPGQVGVAPDSGAEGSERGQVPLGGVFFHPRNRHAPLTRDEVASLCPVVVRIAQQGDWKALEILLQAGYELGRLAAAVIQRLGMEQETFAVVPFGGVFRAGDLVLGSFRETVAAAAPAATVVRPRFEPVVGAVLLALSEISVPIDAAIVAAVDESAIHLPTCQAG